MIWNIIAGKLNQVIDFWTYRQRWCNLALVISNREFFFFLLFILFLNGLKLKWSSMLDSCNRKVHTRSVQCSIFVVYFGCWRCFAHWENLLFCIIVSIFKYWAVAISCLIIRFPNTFKFYSAWASLL